MKRKIVTQLVLASYADNKLNSDRVNKIATLLRRKELKQYINAVKLHELRSKVTITSAFPLDKKDQEGFTNLFPDKTIVVQTDPSLILGLRIINTDTVYEMNISDSLHRISKYIEEEI